MSQDVKVECPICKQKVDATRRDEKSLLAKIHQHKTAAGERCVGSNCSVAVGS